jgi:streptomycin 6-kinase
MLKLWRPVPAGAPIRPVGEWFAAFDRHRARYGGAGPLPERLFEYAVKLAPELLNSAPSTVLLHGDFHHYNILSATREAWLAIDPKGMSGDPGYDVGVFMYNPGAGQDGAGRSPAMLRRRLDILAEELDYDRNRLRDWGIVAAVLSACWSAEESSEGWRDASVSVAEMLMTS